MPVKEKTERVTSRHTKKHSAGKVARRKAAQGKSTAALKRAAYRQVFGRTRPPKLNPEMPEFIILGPSAPLTEPRISKYTFENVRTHKTVDVEAYSLIEAQAMALGTGLAKKVENLNLTFTDEL